MKVFKHEIPVNDLWHERPAPALHFGSQTSWVVSIWADSDTVDTREYRVFGTGQQAEGKYEGTTVSTDGLFVWHVFSREVQS